MGSTVAQWLALLPHSARNPGSIPALGDCVEFAHSPRVCVNFLRVLRFPPTVQRFFWFGLIWFIIVTCINIQWKVLFLARYTDKTYRSQRRKRESAECNVTVIARVERMINLMQGKSIQVWQQQGRSCSWVGWYVTSDFCIVFPKEEGRRENVWGVWGS